MRTSTPNGQTGEGGVFSNPEEQFGQKSQFSKEKWLPLARDVPVMISHYCCQKMKKRPLQTYQRRTGMKPCLGTMAEESRLRTQAWVRHGCNAFEATKQTSQPLSFWTEQDVLRYTLVQELPMASIYGDIVAVDEDGNEYDPDGMIGGCVVCYNNISEWRYDALAKLYFKYGAMGSSKTAQALITKYNYEENDMKVWLIKPSADTRDGAATIRSRIGLEAQCEIMLPDTDIHSRYLQTQNGKCHVVIVDECQFLTEEQIQQLRAIVDECKVPVLCFGLRTDFLTRLFPGSRRLMELADCIEEIKTMCDCGCKATVNARISDGYIVTEGAQVQLGGNDSYIAMCHRCYQIGIREHKKIKLHGQN